MKKMNAVWSALAARASTSPSSSAPAALRLRASWQAAGGVTALAGLLASGSALAHPGHVEDVAAGFTAGLLLAGLFLVAGGGVLLRRWLRRAGRSKE